MAATKFIVKHILTHNLLPGNGDPTARGKGTPFCIYVCEDNGSVWSSDAEGNIAACRTFFLARDCPSVRFPHRDAPGVTERRAVTEPMESRAVMEPILLYRVQHRPYPARKGRRSINSWPARTCRT